MSPITGYRIRDFIICSLTHPAITNAPCDPRLTLREFRAADFDALYAIDSRPESVRYEPQLNADGVSAYLHEAEMQAYVQPRTLFRFAVTRTPDDTVRGLVGLSLNIRMTRDWEIGWSIHPDDWGQG